MDGMRGREIGDEKVLNLNSSEDPTRPRDFGQVRSSLRCSVTTWIKRHSFRGNTRTKLDLT